jgi:hypothetical protein
MQPKTNIPRVTQVYSVHKTLEHQCIKVKQLFALQLDALEEKGNEVSFLLLNAYQGML